ncbi:MAG: ChaN family lipoprotein [Oryzomonas sp.]|uniref:ChaN family lipoprotein n=1 Tax=Oryzomonas sp. TaxID=2855186 RepID=UPI0028486B70|nr:ChaN family lipoprotein [Oryzomonas sp.]MDR3579131.1 ChaN family lipoprotein [Oryzomonas sp.]
MKTFIVLTLMAATVLSTSIGANAAMDIVGMNGKGPVDFGKFVEDIGRSEVIFIGDTHDDNRIHVKQLEIIRALYAGNHQLAIGLEMFTTDSQRYLDDWTTGKLDEKEFAAIYARNWSYDWGLYRDLFIFSRDNHIPMIALNVPKAIIAKVVRLGAASLDENDKSELPPGLHWTLHPRQAEYLRRIREQAFRNAPTRIPAANFEEAQALRNNTMAYNIVKYRRKFPERKVIAIAGTWHAIKNGAPESLKDYGSATYKVVLPDLVEFGWLKPTTEDVDYLIPRGD